MKRLFVCLVAFAAVSLYAQERSNITVKQSETDSGVVVVTAQYQPVAEAASNARDTKGHFELHCNQGVADCKAPAPGNYLMVRLPENWGAYDCVNVDLYPAAAEPATSQKIGEYCLITR